MRGLLNAHQFVAVELAVCSTIISCSEKRLGLIEGQSYFSVLAKRIYMFAAVCNRRSLKRQLSPHGTNSQ